MVGYAGDRLSLMVVVSGLARWKKLRVCLCISSCRRKFGRLVRGAFTQVSVDVIVSGVVARNVKSNVYKNTVESSLRLTN